MNRFAVAVVVVGLALSSALASQGRGQFGGEGGSAPLVPELLEAAGTTRRGSSSYQGPSAQGAAFELAATQSVTAVEEHYRKQLIGAGWKVESTGGDATIAHSGFTVQANAGTRAATLVVTPIETGRLWIAIRVVQSMTVPAPTAPKTDAEMMDWMLRQVSRSAPGETPTVASDLPSTFPTELLPSGFKRSRVLATANGATVAGTVENAKPSDLTTFFATLRKAGWSDRLRSWMAQPFIVADFCKNDVRASIVFNVDPKRVVMAGVTTAKAEALGCESTARQSPGISGPVVVLPSEWSPAHVDGGGGGLHSRAGMRLNTTTPVASILANIEAQIVASGYKATARTSDATQSHVRFESTQTPGSPAIVLLSLTKLPWSSQIDAVHEVVALPKR